MPSESVPEVGSQLGSYRIELLLGRGGMGVVYRATDLRLGRKVALKLLAPHLTADARFRERFLAESRLAASIDHAGIIPIYEAGEAEGHLFIAMRYVEGTDLAELLRAEGALNPDRAVGLVAQLADALDAAHARGLVHRDVKPSNALVVREGAGEHVYLADFGLTKQLLTEGSVTASDQLVGTVDYLAPERIRGEPADGRADLYALGCVLFECLTGTPPFPRDTEAAAFYAHLEDVPPRVSERRPGLPRALDDVVARALAKEPRDRWPSGAALTDAARAALPGGGGAARTRSLHRHRGPPARVLAGLAAVAGALAVGGLLLAASGDEAALAIPDADAVAVIDPDERALVADVRAGSSPSQLAAGAGAVWTIDPDRGSVSRIDARTQTVRETIDVGDGPSAVAVGAGGIWVTNALEGTLSWISLATKTLVDTITVGNGPTGVCVADGAVWVALSYDNRLLRFDPQTRQRETTPLDDRPTELACGGGSVWATSESAGTVTQVATRDGQVVRTIGTGDGASGVAFGAGGVWVANTRAGTVSWIDPVRGVPRGLVPIGPDAGPRQVAIAGDDVWVSNEAAGTVVRIDPARARVADTLRVSNRPQGLVIVGGRLWLGIRGSGARHRGGTLLTLHPRDEETVRSENLDPAIAYSPARIRLLGLTNDGLVGFNRVGGRRGATPVADLAVALPMPTDGGRTYTFQLRRGVRYSTGAPVRAADLRRGLERALSHSAVPAWMYATIRGARRCGPARSGCDLSEGIRTDDRARTVVFRLSERDPDFLLKLAMPFASAVPASTPTRLSTEPLPATGPYRIVSFRHGSGRLVRNPRFRPVPGRPDGYPDVIVWKHGGELRDALHAVEAGRGDLLGGTVLSGLPKGEVEVLATRYAGQLHRNVQPQTFTLHLDTDSPPFDRLAARQALNYAIDRRRSVAFQGGERFAEASCQMLPPSFPGYRPYCPYTADAGPGRPWSAPDLARARRLVAQSGTKGMRVRIAGPPTGYFAIQARQARTALAQIGYRPTLYVSRSSDGFFDYIGEAANRVRVYPIWWGADYASADNYINGMYSCSSDRTVCDTATRRLIAQARRLQAAGRPADAAWSKVDRRLTDRAAVVPLTDQRWADVVSPRVGNYQFNPQHGVLLDQLWVR
jgi:ABC-type transport system substrate-binding protein/DNA-binding beta-propeller fold protein YncE